MPASRAVALLDRLNWRSNTGRAVAVVPTAGAAGTLIITSYVLPAAINTSLCTRGTPGRGLPSSAINEKPAGTVPPVGATPVCDPTMEGTCMRKPAFTKRTKTEPVAGTVGEGTGNNEADALVLLNATPLNR